MYIHFPQKVEIRLKLLVITQMVYILLLISIRNAGKHANIEKFNKSNYFLIVIYFAVLIYKF